MVATKLKKIGYASLPCHESGTYDKVTNWLERHVIISAGTMVTLKDLYTRYKGDTPNGCSKVVFFKIFQAYFFENIEKEEISIITRSGRNLLGVDIKDN